MKSLLTIPACVCVLGIWGCAGHSHRLARSDDPSVSAGSFSHERMEKRAIILEIDGQRYSARGFEVHRSQNLTELRRRYRAGSKHYYRILSGLDTNHYVYSANPELHSDNGLTTRCSLTWRAFGVPAGTCRMADGKPIRVQFE